MPVSTRAGKKMTGLAEFGRAAYTDPIGEATRCRQQSALFDFSFMARARLHGPSATQCLLEFQSRDITAMQPGQILYGVIEDARGQVIADITTWKLAENDFEIYLGRHQDLGKIVEILPKDTVFTDLSINSCIFSLQGPESLQVLGEVCDYAGLASLPYFGFSDFSIAGIPCRIGRLGYTGEKGFEIVLETPSGANKVWQVLAKISRPAGMLAADILRIEAGFILFLNECRFGCTAAELGLGKFSRSAPPDCRYELVCFTATAPESQLPWAPSADATLPNQGELLVTSANLTTLSTLVLGLGIARTSSKEIPDLFDLNGIFSDIQRVNRPYYNARKDIPREPWTSTS